MRQPGFDAHFPRKAQREGFVVTVSGLSFRTRRCVACLIATTVLLVCCVTDTVNTYAEPPDERNAAKPSAPAETLEAVAQRLKGAIPGDWQLMSPARFATFESRRSVWLNTPTPGEIVFPRMVPYVVTPALPTDKVGQRPADYGGPLSVEVIATNGRYTLLAGGSWDPELAGKVVAASGCTCRRRRSSSGFGTTSQAGSISAWPLRRVLVKCRARLCR